IFKEDPRPTLAENEGQAVGSGGSLNPSRGCFHACSYCRAGDTPILMGDGRAKTLADVRVGDQFYGTAVSGPYRRYVKTVVLNRWRRVEPAYRVTLQDGTRLVAREDHRFLTTTGWKTRYARQ